MFKDEVSDIEIWNRLSRNYGFTLRNSGRNFCVLFGFLAVIYLVFVLGVLNLFNHASQSGNMIKSLTHGYILLFLSLSVLGIIFSLIWIKVAKAAKARVAAAKTKLMLYEISKFCDLEYANESSYVDYIVEFMGEDDAINKVAQICEFAQEVKSYKGRALSKAEQKNIEKNYFKFLGDKATLTNSALVEGGSDYDAISANVCIGYTNLLFFLACFAACLAIFEETTLVFDVFEVFFLLETKYISSSKSCE